MRFSVVTSAFNDRGPAAMERVLDALHDANADREPVTLSLRRSGPTIGLAIEVPPALEAFVPNQLRTQYPLAQIALEREDAAASSPVSHSWHDDVTLRPDVFALKRFPQLEQGGRDPAADPLAGILSVLAGQGRDPLHPRMELVIRPAGHAHVRRAEWTLRQLRRPRLMQHHRPTQCFVRLASSPRRALRVLAHCLAPWLGRIPAHAAEQRSSRTHDRETPFQAAEDKLRRQLFDVRLRLIVEAPASHKLRALAKLQELRGVLGQFVMRDQAAWHVVRKPRTSKPRDRPAPFLLSAEELATLWHVPTLTIQMPTLECLPYRQLAPPPVLPSPLSEADTATLGQVVFRDDRRAVALRSDDRRRHLYIAGKTGMGKSSLLYNLLVNDIRAGRGCCLVDPHGDMAEAVLSAVPSPRTNDVVLFDAGDQQHPIAFNPLADCSFQARPLVASGMLSAFKKIYGDSWGPRMEHIFRNCLLALLEMPGASLVSLVQLLGDAHYRKTVVSRVTDPVVRAFWQQEFATMPHKLQAEAIAPIQNKVGHFVSSPLLRHIIGQPRSTINLRRVMDSGQILVVNLSKGRVGEDASNLLGSLLITAVQLAAMSRADIVEEQRRDFYLYVDEFQNFATESFATILSEARKYRLSLTLANQYLAQMDEAMAAAVFGNVGSLLCFQAGANDAEFLAEQLGHEATAQDLLSLPRYEAYARLLVDGQPSRPFSLRTLAPTSTATDPRRASIIRRGSQRRYGRPVEEVARTIEHAFTA
jgi:hypothetical protein